MIVPFQGRAPRIGQRVFIAPPHTLVAGWPAEVRGDLKPAQRELAEALSGRYVHYKDQYLEGGWSSAPPT